MVPPPGAIQALLDCPQPWCSHLCWIGERYDALTLGLVKWSAAFQRQWPKLVDIALTGQRRGGDTYIRGLEEFRPKKHLGYVAIPSNVLRVWPELQARALSRVFEPGTSAHPRALDMYFAYEFAKARVEVHVHQPPAIHLRYSTGRMSDPRWQVDPRLAEVAPAEA